jgi:hypothetical protein
MGCICFRRGCDIAPFDISDDDHSLFLCISIVFRYAERPSSPYCSYIAI